jgi:hypothetical protein
MPGWCSERRTPDVSAPGPLADWWREGTVATREKWIPSPQIFTIPDPERPALGNCRVNPGHARDFANDVREHDDWVAPALLMRTPEVFSFDPKKHLAGSFEILGISKSEGDLGILIGHVGPLVGRSAEATRSRCGRAARSGYPRRPRLALVDR